MGAIDLRNELQNILSGKSTVSEGDLIQTITGILRGGEEASRVAQSKQQDKSKETERLISVANEHQLWVRDLDFSQFISAGAEQRVYIKAGLQVYKLNDAIYYSTWLDYFQNLLLNNFFFPDTAYRLAGFYQENGVLFAVVEQVYVKADEPTDLSLVREFLANNGFLNIRNHDYYNQELGIILEDLHDENVLTQSGMLYFIDTVFFIKSDVFWKTKDEQDGR